MGRRARHLSVSMPPEPMFSLPVVACTKRSHLLKAEARVAPSHPGSAIWGASGRQGVIKEHRAGLLTAACEASGCQPLSPSSVAPSARTSELP